VGRWEIGLGHVEGGWYLNLGPELCSSIEFNRMPKLGNE
jgi:hypothetical protein